MQVSKWGNSLAIRLPQAVVEALQLKEGDEVFRTYKGKEYRAIAQDGYLVMNGQKYNRLSQLSLAIGAVTENSWTNWYVMGVDGKRMLISALRPS